MTMFLSLLLATALAAFTFFRWERTTLASAETNIAQTPHRFCFASSAGRRTLVAAGYWLLVLIVVGGLGYGLGEFVLAVLAPVGDVHPAWRTGVIMAMVLLVATAFQLPGLRLLVSEIRQVVVRHLFFPVLPTEKEEQVIERLLPVSIPAQSSSMTQSAGGFNSEEERAGICFQQAQVLTATHAKLSELINDKTHFWRGLWYGEEWELVDNLYHGLMHQLHREPAGTDPALLEKLQLCHYYCCHLIVRYIFSTCLTRRQCQRKFRQFGLDVEL